MKKPVLVSLMMLSAGSIFAQKNNTFETLIDHMQGSFSSLEQAENDSDYFHITLDMKRIWNKNKKGAWLYVEQTAASTPGRPYRQRIYHLQQVSDSVFTSTIYKFENEKSYVGGHQTPEQFNRLKKKNLDELEGCTLELTYNNGVFSGKTKKGSCLNNWGKATYATSEVTISSSQMVSWDQGWNDSDEQVWGATKGGYVFKKVEH